jgi:hypothetical protein
VQQWLRSLTPQQLQQLQQWVQNMTPEQQRQLQGQMQQWLQEMLPEQQRQFQQTLQGMPPWLQDMARDQQRWSWIRQTFVSSGFVDTGVQDAVIAFMQAQDNARQPLRAMARALTTRLVNPAATDEQLKAQLATFREAVEQDAERYQQGLQALDARVNYSTQPRLETLLTVLGVVGQETPTLGGVGALFPESPLGNQGMSRRGARGQNNGGQEADGVARE